MKELSIEEKAKRYDEAKLRMSAAYNSNRCTIGFMNEIFPELKESEDERIKKVLIDYFNRYKEREECGIKTFYGIPTDNILAWFEKQGEQKPAWSEEDDIMANDICYALSCQTSYPISRLQSMSTWINNLKDRVQPQ